MIQEYIIDKITEAVEEIGWGVTTHKQGEGVVEINFNTYTLFGQDLNCWGILEGDDYDSFLKEIQNWYYNFDPDESAVLWVGPDGHGMNGAPYRLRDILTDMEDAQSKLKDLTIALTNLNL